MKLGGCEAVIKSDGKVVREVGTTLDDDGKTASCFLVSQPGKVSAGMQLMDCPTPNLTGPTVKQEFLIEYRWARMHPA